MGQVETLKARVEELEAELAKFRDRHPAARLNRYVKLGGFAIGVLVLSSAAVGLSFGEGGSVTLHWMLGLLLIAPETLGAAAATDAVKAFASSFGATAAKVATKKGKK